MISASPRKFSSAVLLQNLLGLSCLLSLSACAAGQNAPSPPPVPGGELGVMPLGSYLCTLPGRADIVAAIPEPSRDFSIRFGSIYEAAEGKGTYLLTGKYLQFTSGPRQGEQFIRSANNTVRALSAEGAPEKLLCTRRPV